MRITYLHQYFNTPQMVGGTRSYEMARRLVARGHQVNVITSWRGKTESKRPFMTVEDGINVHWIPILYSNSMTYASRMLAFGRFAFAAARTAANLSADVVFATSTPLTIALPGAYSACRRKVPMVFEVRDLWPELPIAIGVLKNPVLKYAARVLERFAYGCSDHVIALSPGMRDGVVRSGYPEDRVTVIPNSSDLVMFDPSATDSKAFRARHPEIGDRRIVVYAGTLGEINGVSYLVDIAAAALRRGSLVCFVVVGSGQQDQAVRETAVARGVLGRNFFMYPPIPKIEVPGVLAAADLALSLFIDLPPMWANSANKFFDALASGTPVAINYSGWQAELLNETGAGVVLPAADAIRSAEILDQWFSQPFVVRQRAGAAARSLAETKFSRDVLAERLAVVLERVSAQHARQLGTSA